MEVSNTKNMPDIKPCPFCGGRAVSIVKPKILVRCVWIECSECRVTTPMLEYKSDTEDVKELDARLRETRRQVTAFWNTRAGGDDDGTEREAAEA